MVHLLAPGLYNPIITVKALSDTPLYFKDIEVEMHESGNIHREYFYRSLYK
jgi:hypothetical protein